MHTWGSLKEQHFLLMIHYFIYPRNYYSGLDCKHRLEMHINHSVTECGILRLFHSHSETWQGALAIAYFVWRARYGNGGDGESNVSFGSSQCWELGKCWYTINSHCSIDLLKGEPRASQYRYCTAEAKHLPGSPEYTPCDSNKDKVQPY